MRKFLTFPEQRNQTPRKIDVSGTWIFAGLIALSSAQPAVADIVIFAGNNPQINESIVFTDQGPAGTILGSFGGGTDNFVVTGTTAGGTDLFSALSGTISGSGSNITSLDFSVAGGGLYNNFILDLISTGAAGTLSLQITDDANEFFSTNFAFGNGNNFFTILGINGESIRTVSVTGGSFTSVRSIRAALVSNGTALPEPATWTMMLMGFGAIGFAMRRRQQTELTFRRAA
jgi:hypothetical protein